MAASPFTPFLPTSWRTGTGTLEADGGPIDGAYSYVRAGDGPRTLLVLPGFGDAMFSGRYPPAAGPAVAAYFARYLETHTVYVLSRPRGLPEDLTIETAAEDHARLLETAAAEFGAGDDSGAGDDLGPVDVVGISMGGLIGQQLAANYPALVDRLVVVDGAYRLGDPGREPALELLETARAHDWTSVRSQLAEAMFAGWRRISYPSFLQTIGRFVQPRPAEPTDVPRSIAAILAYDGADALAAIEQPTLVIGGRRDPYFTADVMAQTASGVQNGSLSLLPGAKHGAFHERKAAFDSRVTEYLASVPAPSIEDGKADRSGVPNEST